MPADNASPLLEDEDALFDGPAPAAPERPTWGSSSAGPEARNEPRVKVSWRARIQLPGGSVRELRLRDLSENGVGLLTEFHIPAAAVLNFAIAVPDLNVPGIVRPVAGTIKTTYLVLQGCDLLCGGMWVTLPAEGRDLLSKWIRRLRK